MGDLISRKVAIDEINDLLKSPYAHSRLGAISEEDAYYIRKEMAGTIIDLCLKSAKTVYDLDKVIKQLADKIDPNEDFETGENCNNWVVDMQNDLIDDCIKIVNEGVNKDEN